MRVNIVFLTKLLVLVTLKKSSMRVCLLCPATDSDSFLSSRLLARVSRNFSIRWRTLVSLKTHQEEHSYCCLGRKGGGGKAHRDILDMFRMAEEANKCFLIWLTPYQFYRVSVYFVKKQSPCFCVLPEMWYWMGLAERRYSCHYWKYIFL